MELESESKGKKINGHQRVGLVYDERMCKHATPNGNNHPENPNRILAIWRKLQSAGIIQRCVVLDAKEAEDNYIASVHTKSHIDLIKRISTKNFDSHRKRLASKFNSIYFNEGSSEAASLAAGSVIEAAEKVAKGELDSAFAIVRPPGHHAEEDEPMGFCLYNNVAIATNYLLNKGMELGIGKILLVDWDVHHGNGTQKTFWKDPRVLFFSVHRHEFGGFYPASDHGSHIMIGEGPGTGYTINVPWENGQCGDADYFAVWDNILIPVAKEFNPDIILISAGFDAAINDPLGGCCVTPYGYSVMLRKLKEFAQGKIVMVLEGGYNLNSLANSALSCVEVLLEDKPITGSAEAYPFESTWRVIKSVREELSKYWPILADELPKELPSRKIPPVQIPFSDSDDENENENENENVPFIGSEDSQKAVQDITEPLSKLKLDLNSNESANKSVVTSPQWRSELSKIDVWYSSYGSNMSEARMLCYIRGGKVEGMKKVCTGSMDKSPPKETLWKIVPHRLFFGRDYSNTWGPGGVAFLNPQSNTDDKAYICMYKITLEQFNDVLLQENALPLSTDSPLFDLSSLDSITNTEQFFVESIKTGWYHNVVYMGKENDIPILTMTCTVSEVGDYKSGKLPLREPNKEYSNTLVKGLVLGNQLSEEEAIAYIHGASTQPLLLSTPKA